MGGERASAQDDREGARLRRHQIRERLARSVYEREKERDPTDRNRQSSWENLNEGRRATRLNYADELLTTIVGALGFEWSMVEGMAECVRRAAETGDESVGEEAEQVERLIDILSALLPRPVR